MGNIGNVSAININGNEMTVKDAAVREVVNKIISAIGANNSNIAERINDLHGRSFDYTLEITSNDESEIINIQDGIYKLHYVTVTGSGDNEIRTLNNSSILIQKENTQYLYKDGQILGRIKTNNSWGEWQSQETPHTLSSNYEMSSGENSELFLEGGDTYEEAFGKIEKAILDNEEIITNSLIELDSKINNVPIYNSSNKLSADFIENGETNKVINIKPNWNAIAGSDSEILNKPTKTSEFINDGDNGATLIAVSTTGGSYTKNTENSITVNGTILYSTNMSEYIYVTNDGWVENGNGIRAHSSRVSLAIPNLLKGDVITFYHNANPTDGVYESLVNAEITEFEDTIVKFTMTASGTFMVTMRYGSSFLTYITSITFPYILTRYVRNNELSTVATSGSYDDLLNTPTIPTVPSNVSSFTNDANYATKTEVNTAISNIIDSSPDALNTLNELSAALNDDANFATTMNNALAAKANSNDLAAVATSGSYNDLSDTPDVPIQSDWTQNINSEQDYIKHKPTKTSDFVNNGEGGDMVTHSTNTKSGPYTRDTESGITINNQTVYPCTDLGDTNIYLSIDGWIESSSGIRAYTGVVYIGIKNLEKNALITFSHNNTPTENTYTNIYNAEIYSEETKKVTFRMTTDGDFLVRMTYGKAYSAYITNITYYTNISRFVEYDEMTNYVNTNYLAKNNAATVATSGSYNDLSDKPTIPMVPTNVSSFTNDAGYITNIKNVTYSNLVTLKNNNNLVPGQQYRITDYVTTTALAETQSAEHAFDIIVTADSTNTINENARAIQHDGDTYFNNSKLESWEIKYCLDNDTDKFGWASKIITETTSFNFNEIGSSLSDKTVVSYSSETVSINDISCNIGINESEGLAFQGPTGWLWRSYGVLQNGLNSGTRTFGILNLRAGSIVTVLCDTGAIESYSNLTNNADGTYTVVSDGNIGFRITRAGALYEININYTYGTEGKGVIYYMKDEFNNECPYDFKNMLFKRCKTTKSGSFYNDLYFGVTNAMGDELPYDATLNKNDYKYLYTFTTYTSNYAQIKDASLNNGDSGVTCYQNVIPACNDQSGDFYGVPGYIPNNIVFQGQGNFYNNSFGAGCCYNTIKNYCQNNTIGNSFWGNTIGNNFYNNSFGAGCCYNTIKNYCQNNTIGNNCNNNIIGNYFTDNTIGNNFQYNTIGNYCRNNTIGNSFSFNTIGNESYNNTIGNDCNNITIGKEYVRYIVIEDGNKNFTLTSTQTTSSSNYLQNIYISLGVNNSDSAKTISHNTVDDQFKTTYQSSNSQIINV